MAQSIRKESSQRSLVPRNSALAVRPTSLPLPFKQEPILQSYLQNIREYPLLSKEEEFEAAVDWFENKNILAKKKLVTSNLRLVVKIAMEYASPYVSLMDLIQEGNEGLMIAVERFDPYRGVKLSTYSAWWIKAFILKFLMDSKSLVRMGTTDSQRKLFFRLRSEAERIYAFTNKYDIKMIADHMGVKESEVVSMQQRLQSGDLSLDRAKDDESTTNLLQVLESDLQRPLERVEHEQLLVLLNGVLKDLEPHLSDRERAILTDRLLNDDPMTLQAFGDQYGISRERVRQIETKLLEKIREAFHSRQHVYSSLPSSRVSS